MMDILSNPVTWIGVAFFIFMAGFCKYALPFILRSLDNRSVQIRDELNEAIRLREEAQAILADYQQRQQKMLAEAESMLAHAEKEATTLIADAEKELRVTIERRTRLAHEKIERAEADAIAQVQANMVDIAISAARTVIEEQLEKEGDEAQISQALKGLERIVH